MSDDRLAGSTLLCSLDRLAALATPVGAPCEPGAPYRCALPMRLPLAYERDPASAFCVCVLPCSVLLLFSEDACVLASLDWLTSPPWV